MRDSRGPCSEKGPFPARYSRGVSSDGGLRGISDAWRAYPAKASSFRMRGARILPRTGDFPVRGHFRDAWSAKLATDRRPGTHRGGILPRIDARERTAQEYCHCQSGQERITAQSRHRRTLENASREHFAIGERPGTHQGIILPWQAARKCIAATPCHGSLLQECFSTTYCQESPRLPGLAAKSQWCRRVGRRHQNETLANSTPHADTSKKP